MKNTGTKTSRQWCSTLRRQDPDNERLKNFAFRAVHWLHRLYDNAPTQQITCIPPQQPAPFVRGCNNTQRTSLS